MRTSVIVGAAAIGGAALVLGWLGSGRAGSSAAAPPGRSVRVVGAGSPVAATASQEKPPSPAASDAVIDRPRSPRASLSEVAASVREGIEFSGRKRQLLTQLRSERRDEPWASEAEAALEGAYAAMPKVIEAGRSFAIHCAATLCEVYGEMPSAPQDQSTVRNAVDSVEVIQQMSARGYASAGTLFAPSSTGNRQLFLTYWWRAAAR